MTEGLSASDVLALTKNGDNDNWMNNPFIYLVWLALLGGNGIFGNKDNDGTAALRTAITEGNANQDIFRNFGELTANLDGFQREAASSWGNLRFDLLNGLNTTNANIADSRFAQQSCCCETNRNIDSVKAEAYQNTCAITNAIHSEAEATRSLIEQNTIQALRDKIEDKDRELQSANFLISQANQNAALISALRPTPIPAYTVSSPYVSNTSSCGCTMF